MPSDSHNFMVPSSKVGRIIGKKGSKIRELQQDTRTRIIVSNSNSDVTNVEIRGDQRDVVRAKALIQQVIDGDEPAEYQNRSYQNRLRNKENLENSHQKCYNCGKNGHISRNCDQDPGDCSNAIRNGLSLTGTELWGDPKAQEFQCSVYGTEDWNQSQTRESHRISVNGNDEEDWEAEAAEDPQPVFMADPDSFQMLSLDDEDDERPARRGRGRGGGRNWQQPADLGQCRSIKPDYSGGRGPGRQRDSKKSLEGTLIWAMQSRQQEEEENIPVMESKPVDFAEMRRLQEEYDRQKFEGLPPVVKNFYKEHSDVANMSEMEVAEFRKLNNDIQIINLAVNDSDNIPNPVRTFYEAFHNDDEILEQIRRQGFKKPSPIQCQAWPVLLRGKDLIGIAQTGTGKTLAFLLPALIHICGQPLPREQRGGPTVLIVCPTRELALQIEEEVNKIRYKNVSCVCLYGGASRRRQIDVVKKGVDIVVATPGRLNDLVDSKIISVKYVTFLVLDEADRMLDLGFEAQIRLFMLDIRPDRQTVMTSATWPADVQELADRYMKDPIKINIGSLELTAVHTVEQRVEIIEEYNKKDRLFNFIFEEITMDDKVIVFVGRKVTADDIASDLAIEGINCRCIHGDREQADREQCMKEMKSGECRILIATDVASRGLDVKDITYVFNYDFPRNIEEYVHRIGRTGRAGKTGIALSLMTYSDGGSAQPLINILLEANQVIPDELYSLAERNARYQQQNRGWRGKFRNRYGRN
ncbi:probable ATP-dependent RNA helicase DDX43 isoform X1 [Octopus bimaculoides]|uniref:RNA helicase n=1 Tax=Octopus bimaculoides TaxID=37653 RepID=A0A0L8GIW3_OCTBM|nr:probable ATP-dependent RNA helicase DDX43 isoform X1 [Octopus bimaculoides]|eukprot:XP_014780985.1 PREDICTED: probable ATP-dependent RNA helicase DDX43 isoform X1 [Octopus bimaculoides]